MPEAPKAGSAPRGGLRVRIGVVLGLAALQALRGRQLRRPKGREAPDQSRDLPVSAGHRWSAALVTPLASKSALLRSACRYWDGVPETAHVDSRSVLAIR
jgi:hypothetical protein